MDLGSIIVAALLSLGLIGTDAVLNAGTVNFDVQVTEDLSKRGFTAPLIDAMMDNNLKKLIEFRSIVHPPQVRSTQEKSVVGSVADSLNLKEVTQSFQSDFGLNPVRLTGSLMQTGKDGQEFRFILAGNSQHTGEFTIDETSGERPLPAFLVDVAEEVVSRLEPYAAALYEFKQISRNLVDHPPPPGELKSAHEQFNTYIEQLVRSEAGRQDSDVDHAAFHNLLGLAALMMHDPAQAEDGFKMAMMLDPAQGVPMINLGLQYVSQHRFQDAIAMADKALLIRDVRRVPYLVSNAHTVKALALWGMNDLHGASANFLAAVKAYPSSFWAYFYWAELLNSAGNTKDSDMLQARAQDNLNTFETYPEVAFMHVQVLTGADFTLKPIDLQQVRHVSEIYAEK
jgi:tetratricopeptide (TPR) repeat protein